MNILHLRTLVAVHDHPTFADAAAALYITPAAVSQQMRHLEDQLQTPLFDRTTRPPRLNAHGESVVEKARDVLSQFDALVDMARSPGEIAGILTLGTATGISSSVIPRALAQLQQRYPKLQVRIDEGMTDHLIQRVRRRQLDAALITAPMIPETDMKMLRIMDVPLVVVTPVHVAASDWKSVVSGEPFLGYNPISGLGRLINGTLKRAGVNTRETMELDSSESICRLVEAGLGVGVVPETRVAQMDRSCVNVLPFGDPQVYQSVVLIERTNAHRSGLADVLYEQLLQITEGEEAANV